MTEIEGFITHINTTPRYIHPLLVEVLPDPYCLPEYLTTLINHYDISVMSGISNSISINITVPDILLETGNRTNQLTVDGVLSDEVIVKNN